MGQRKWEQKKMIDLQCQALSKCVNAVRGARKELVSVIAGVESPRMTLDAAQARLLGKMMRDPTALEDMWSGPVKAVSPAEVGEGTNWEAGRSGRIVGCSGIGTIRMVTGSYLSCPEY